MRGIALFLVLLVAVSGCAQQHGNVTLTSATQGIGEKAKAVEEVKVVEAGDKVKAEYVGRFTDGTVFDQSAGRGPLEFVAGSGQMIKGFDEGVIGMKLNDEKTVTIPPEKAYGTEGSGQKVEVPLDRIEGKESLQVGSTIATDSGMQGKVIGIKDGIATIEFVHPLAGKTLVFWIKVVDIRKATD